MSFGFSVLEVSFRGYGGALDVVTLQEIHERFSIKF